MLDDLVALKADGHAPDVGVTVIATAYDELFRRFDQTVDETIPHAVLYQ